jgi:hypothetical protein
MSGGMSITAGPELLPRVICPRGVAFLIGPELIVCTDGCQSGVCVCCPWILHELGSVTLEVKDPKIHFYNLFDFLLHVALPPRLLPDLKRSLELLYMASTRRPVHHHDGPLRKKRTCESVDDLLRAR